MLLCYRRAIPCALAMPVPSEPLSRKTPTQDSPNQTIIDSWSGTACTACYLQKIRQLEIVFAGAELAPDHSFGANLAAGEAVAVSVRLAVRRFPVFFQFTIQELL